MNSPRTAFVVDDEEAIRLSVGALLRLWGVTVHAFSSAEEFWLAYRDSWRGLLLVDLRLPGQSGLVLLEELQRRGSSLSAFLVTGHGEEAIFRQSLECGALGAFAKPFDAKQLKTAIDCYLPQE